MSIDDDAASDLESTGATLSVVAPMYNEEANVMAFYQCLVAVLDPLGLDWELVCVNDGSSDATLAILSQLHQRDPRVKVVDLSRNFGKEMALTAGLDYATGTAVIPMDADLQHPPELIPELLARWREGYEVVNAARRIRRGETWVRKSTARTFYRLLGAMATVPVPPDTGDFRLLARPVVQALRRLPERNRYMKGLFSWVGFRQTTVFFDQQPRHAGTSTWNYWRLWNFAWDGITSLSSWPLRVWSYIGLAIATLALLYATGVVVNTLIHGVDVPGYASLLTAILFLGGVQLISLGVIGEYLGRMFEEVKGRPPYLVRGLMGLSNNHPLR